jgi:phosphate uptake regulator
MPIPTQDVKDSYTLDEVQHLIAREWAKNEILSLKAGSIEFQKQLVEIGGATNAELKHLRESLQEFPSLVANQISHCREDMRREMTKDFPDRIETKDMEKRIEDKISQTDSTLGKQISSLDKKVDGLEVKVDKQWLKITVIVSTIVAIGGFVQWLLTTGKAVVG